MCAMIYFGAVNGTTQARRLGTSHRCTSVLGSLQCKCPQTGYLQQLAS